MRSRSNFLTVLVVALIGFGAATPANAQSTDALDSYRAQRDAFIDGFRIEGKQDRSRLDALTSGLAALTQQSTGELHARALLELAGAQRMGDDYQGAIASYTEAAKAAEALGLRDVAFGAWLGIARAHEYGTSDHGRAALAFERAVDAAGEQITPKQNAELADYRAQLEIGRGELEAGIIDALRAINLAAEPKDRFYAEDDLGDGLTKLVQSCDYRPLIDARSDKDGADAYGACRRAVAAADAAYQSAGATATALGWTFLSGQTQQFRRNLELRRLLIENRARLDARIVAVPFHPRSINDVLLSKTFESGASMLNDAAALAKLIDVVVSEADAKAGAPSARSQYLRGLRADMRGDQPAKAAEYYAAAATVIGEERRGFFDPRRRGTVIENRGEMIESLALRLLSLGRETDAFAAFESVRARGLSELASVLGLPDVTPGERSWLADLLVLDAGASAIERRLVADLVADGKLDTASQSLRDLDDLRAARRAKLRGNEAARARFAAEIAPHSASLEELQKATAATKIPVLLYWTTYANVIAWYVGPDGSDVRAVFLPASVLEEKAVRGVLKSVNDASHQFDEATARELFLYLIAPFASHLNSDEIRQIMIVPQGALARLPFETLIDPASGAAVVDRWAVSYAPSATMALAALQRKQSPLKSAIGLVNQEIDDVTKETAAINASGVRFDRTTRSALFAGSWKADGLHILTHGDFNSTEALLSSLVATRTGEPNILAAQLPALPLRGLQLAVLSACQGGRIEERISGELYGFPWALLAGGVASTVLSRWDVNAASNGQWMAAFYRELARGVSPAMAAAVAMREMRAQGTTHPHYWAAMQVSGR